MITEVGILVKAIIRKECMAVIGQDHLMGLGCVCGVDKLLATVTTVIATATATVPATVTVVAIVTAKATASSTITGRTITAYIHEESHID